MSGFERELDAADDAAGKLIHAIALCEEASVLVRACDGDVRIIAPDTQKKLLASMLRVAADMLDAPTDRTLQ